MITFRCTRKTAPTTNVDYCPMVLETATRILGPLTDDDTTLKGRIRAPRASGCGPVKGVVKRKADRWVVKTIPQKTP